MVLTGLNGAGKSQLLQAIAAKSILLNELNDARIVHFNYETFKLMDEQVVNTQQVTATRQAAWDFFINNMMPHLPKGKILLRNAYQDLKNKCKSEGKNFWDLSETKLYREELLNFINSWQRYNVARGVLNIAKKIYGPLDEVDKETFISLFEIHESHNEFLPNQIGKTFWDYHIKKENNSYNAFLNQRDNGQRPTLSDKEFITKHGRKPWEIVNQILETFGTIQYRVNSPEDLDRDSDFQIKLIHTEKNGLQLDFGHLSSGEKVMMALVASIYKSSADGLFPNVLLLDEIDASLHPSMIQNMLEVIEDIFIQNGVYVILATHSPTMVALAPEESIYVMNRSGLNRIERKPKQEALAILTEGFATLEQGLRLFDQVSKTNISIISEGHNVTLIKRALELFDIQNVEVIDGVEAQSSKSQLKLIFDFFSRVPHDNTVIIVWDCDFKKKLERINKTIPHTIPCNPQNKLAKDGIENAFPESLFGNFTDSTILANGDEHYYFSKKYKNAFANHVINNATLADFSNFQDLINLINSLKLPT